ncbi:MAG: PQQ-binding-like beta-propeller repeat protein [Gemmataceae bacterium]
MRLRIAAILLVLVAAAGWLIWRPGGPPAPPPQPPEPALLWSFEPLHTTGFVAAPTVTDDAIYLSALRLDGLRFGGAVFAVDTTTGRQRWRFADDGGMRATASAPTLAGGRLFVGDGMHADAPCRVYALDPGGGQKLWEHEVGDHVESTPAVVGDTVFVGAGNDGLLALDAVTAAVRWRFDPDLHIDTAPWVEGGKVYVGSGPSRRFKRCEVAAVDAGTGRPVWRTPTDLPAWGAPRVVGGRVFAGLGNGRLTEPAQPPETPAGAVLCLDAATGAEVWRVRTPDAVFQRPTVADGRVYAGCRDGTLYCLWADSGADVFRVAMGAPVIAPPAVADGRVYAVSMAGLLKCLDAADGREVWRFDLAARTKTQPLMTAAPVVHRGRVYLAGELQTAGVGSAVLLCLQP